MLALSPFFSPSFRLAWPLPLLEILFGLITARIDGSNSCRVPLKHWSKLLVFVEREAEFAAKVPSIEVLIPAKLYHPANVLDALPVAFTDFDQLAKLLANELRPYSL